MQCFRCGNWPCSCSDVTLLRGDCLQVLPALDACSVHAVVTDPPYELGFMGKHWDKSGIAFQPATWEAVARVCKPGACMLAFGGTRTFHRMTVAIEDAGWEIRDCLMWVYGSGFPKSLDVSKAIDKVNGITRPRVPGGQGGNNVILGTRKSGEAISGEAIRWNGWGTALKPAWEPVILARKPLDGTVVNNCLTHGCGAIAVDRCRIGTRIENESGWSKTDYDRDAKDEIGIGRWPSNVIHDGSEEVVELFPETQSGTKTAGTPYNHDNCKTMGKAVGCVTQDFVGDSGSAARFFYCAKADSSERGEGNTHPTVKPLALLEYLCRLLSLPGNTGTLLDPFAGSGSTLLAGTKWFERVIGIEKEEPHCKIAADRLGKNVLF